MLTDMPHVHVVSLRCSHTDTKTLIRQLALANSERPPANDKSDAPLELLAANCHDALLKAAVVDWYPAHDQVVSTPSSFF